MQNDNWRQIGDIIRELLERIAKENGLRLQPDKKTRKTLKHKILYKGY